MLISKPKDIVCQISAEYLIPVKMKLVGRGCPKQFAIICLPKKDDIKKEHSEPLVEDKNSETRKKLRTLHLKELKRLKKKRLISSSKVCFRFNESNKYSQD